jgi:hypothetical protein
MSADAFPILADLRASGPWTPWREPLMTFGQFVGIWDIDVRYYDADGRCSYHGKWEWSFAWILHGRAIQDVLVSLGPADGSAPERDAWGTTVRYCDLASGQWTIYFLGTTSNITTVLHGGPAGRNVVLAGRDPDGTYNEWTFSDITHDSFTWTGMESSDGERWRRNQLMLATRIA